MQTDGSFNIVELIENHPITRLSGTYQNNLLKKIKENFTDNEQQLFVASFYSYLNYNQRTDFVIDLDNVWKWLGFNQKFNAKYMLEKNFVIDNDYKIIAPEASGAKKNTIHIKGGHNKETIMLTIHTFKRFCLKAATKKSEQIHEYYIKLEETIQDVIQQETDELKLQLENKDRVIQKSENEKFIIREKTLIDQFPKNTQCIYYGIIDNLSDNGEKLIKFGNSNHLKLRIMQHRDTYQNFRLMNSFKVDNKLQIESAIKEHSFFKDRLRSITIKNKNHVELLSIDGITIPNIDKAIKTIIMNVEYSTENYIKLLDENQSLKKQLWERGETDNTHAVITLTSENKRLLLENNKLFRKYNALLRKTGNVDTPLSHDISSLSSDNGEPINTNIIKSIKRITKNKDGKYIINGITYDKLFGSRHDVWYGNAYKTTGELTKDDLIINNTGKIISKKKSIHETVYDRFSQTGVNLTPDREPN
uniref:MSV199 domain-containing protein n=1 Tax=viral metagenome TaxID=1070528 RepID=A0A6C0DQ12_9ZZZZ